MYKFDTMRLVHFKKKSDCILVTSADSAFFIFLEAMVKSLVRFQNELRFCFGVLDQGLSDDEKKRIETLIEVTWVKPIWHEWVPSHLRKDIYIGLQARMELRDYFPGYKYYLWFDADAWAQTPEFFNAFVNGAEQCGASVVEEKGVGYRKTFNDLKWWYGNLILCFGPINGLKLIRKSSINIGISCFRNDAPHWLDWKKMYVHCIKNSDKINMDQHALFGAIHLNKIKTKFLNSKYNWLPQLSIPSWHLLKKQFCVPNSKHESISILHLAGPKKDRFYNIKTNYNKIVKKQIIFAL